MFEAAHAVRNSTLDFALGIHPAEQYTEVFRKSTCFADRRSTAWGLKFWELRMIK
jgi:hypothetical protein